MSIQSQIDRLKQAKADLISQITAKGVTVPADASLDDLAALVEAISTGSDPVLQAKTVTPTEASQSVTPDDEYDGLSEVTVNAIPDQYLVEAEVADYTAKLTELGTAISALEQEIEGKAGGNGTSGSVETAEVVFSWVREKPVGMTYTYFGPDPDSPVDTGVNIFRTFVYLDSALDSNGDTLSSVVVGTSVVFFMETNVAPSVPSGGATLVQSTTMGDYYVYVFEVTG